MAQSGGFAVEGAEVTPFTGARVCLSRIQTILPGRQFPYHTSNIARLRPSCVQSMGAPSMSPGPQCLHEAIAVTKLQRDIVIRSDSVSKFQAYFICTTGPDLHVDDTPERHVIFQAVYLRQEQHIERKSWPDDQSSRRDRHDKAAPCSAKPRIPCPVRTTGSGFVDKRRVGNIPKPDGLTARVTIQDGCEDSPKEHDKIDCEQEGEIRLKVIRRHRFACAGSE